MRSKRILIVSSVAMLSVLTACGGDSDGSGGSGGSDAEPFKIVFVSGLSGALEVPANAALDAVEVAADSLNADHDGILGRKVEVEGLDSGGDPTRAVSVLQEYIAKEGKPDYVIPGVSSGETLALLPVLAREQIASSANTSNEAIDDPDAYPYHFGNVPTAAGQMAALAPTLADAGITKVTALLGQDAFGEGNVAALESALEGSDVDLTIERFDPEAVDLTVPFERAKSSNPDAIYLDCFGESCGRLFDAREKVGATDIPTYAGSGVSGTGGGPADFASPAATQNVFMHLFSVQKAVPDGEQSPAFQAFFDAYKEKEGGTIKSSILPAVIAYDGVRLYAAAAEDAGSTDADKVAGVLEDDFVPEADYAVVYPNGPGYTADDHFPEPDPELFSYVAPGPVANGLFESGS
jgi:branched-chain amino acid transport system substrate-binding protein